MVQNDEIRQAFAERLKTALKKIGQDSWGAGTYLKKVVGVTDKAASKWLNAEAMPGRANMLTLADHLGVRIEWLQYGYGEPEARYPSPTPGAARQNVKENNVIPANFMAKGKLKQGEISIPQFNVRAAMGAGQVPSDYVETIRHVTMRRSHLDALGVAFSSPDNLAIITGWGQSMSGTIEDGEPVFIDQGVRSFTGDGVYVFTWDGLMYIKRLQKESKTHFKVISDNRDHDPFTVLINEVIFHARAVLVWNARKL